MADQFLFPTTLRMPLTPPRTLEELPIWASNLQDVLEYQLYEPLARRIEAMVIKGVIADRPAATGEFRFFMSTDEAPPTLYFDNGTWLAV